MPWAIPSLSRLGFARGGGRLAHGGLEVPHRVRCSPLHSLYYVLFLFFADLFKEVFWRGSLLHSLYRGPEALYRGLYRYLLKEVLQPLYLGSCRTAARGRPCMRYSSDLWMAVQRVRLSFRLHCAFFVYMHHIGFREIMQYGREGKTLHAVHIRLVDGSPEGHAERP